MLGKRLLHEHISVRHMVWQKDLGKIRHLEDRTLFDVTEGKNFSYWLKGRITSKIVVSPHKNGKENSRESLEKKNITNEKRVKKSPSKLDCTCLMCNVKKGFLKLRMT